MQDRPPLDSLVPDLAAAVLDLAAPDGSLDRFAALVAERLGATAVAIACHAEGGAMAVLGSAGLLAAPLPPPAPSLAPAARPSSGPPASTRLSAGRHRVAYEFAIAAAGDRAAPRDGCLVLELDDGESAPLLSPERQQALAWLATMLGRALWQRRMAARTHEEVLRLREAQEQLVHAGKMAAIGTLVAGLSHELNNPLGIIVGYAQGLLRRTPEGAPGRDSLLAIERQAQRSAHLVRSLLDFSRSGPATREQTALSMLVERALELAAGQARRRVVALRWEAHGPLPPLTVCPQEIESALLNLLSNAIDATPAGGTVTLSAVPATRDGRDGIEVTIADTGTGIPRAVLSRIFDPFFTTKPVGQGTGIGLALTRQAVEGHGGRIEVQTAEGQGTSMRLWLPLRGLADGVERTPSRPPSTSTSPSTLVPAPGAGRAADPTRAEAAGREGHP